MTTMRRAGVPAELAQAPLRTVRARDVLAYAHPRQQLARLEGRGLLHRLADGFYTVVPQDRVGAVWRPTLEGAAAGIAAAEFGDRQYALMGLTAARVHGAVNRAVALAWIAAPRRREELRLTDRPATIRFLLRDVPTMQLEILQTDLGGCLVTTPEQTVLDLAHLRRAGDMMHDVQLAIRVLLPKCEPAAMEEIARHQRLGRALTFVRQLEPAG